jgi:peptide/nickel transport system permease protein
LKGYAGYFFKKLGWFSVTFILAIVLNFILPRLMPGDPVVAIVGRLAAGSSNPDGLDEVYHQYAELFGTQKPIPEQFFIYIKNVIRGDFGFSFSHYPRKVIDILKAAVIWTIALQFPAILIGWIVGNILGVLAAYRKRGYDKVIMPVSLLVSQISSFGMAILLLSLFAIRLKWFPLSGGYAYDMIPSFRWSFIWSVITHYQLPFFSIVLVDIGGWALGMRAMTIYELNADYIRYSRFMGIGDPKIIGYVFRNAMLPQITSLSLSIGTMIGGNLVAETIFNYPGLGVTFMNSLTERDYPLISLSALVIMIMVLISTFVIEILYGLLDPRIKAVQMEE